MLCTLIATTVFLCAAGDDPPVQKTPPTKKELAAITERGRALAGYDAAAWHASDALVAKKPKEGSVERYIALKTDSGWIVAFGRLDEKNAKFLIAYEAKQGKSSKDFTVRAFTPPKEDVAFLRTAAIAMKLATKEFTDHFEGEQRPYNVAILPAEDSQFFVYLVPAPTKAGVWPIGGDVRYLISKDGQKIVAKRQLHKSIIEIEPPADANNNKPVLGMHTHVLDDIPEDTDVFHVLSRKPSMGEMIATDQFAFVIEIDGSIKYTGLSKDLGKDN